MERILEPEYMDTVEDATDYDAMDHGSANQDVTEAFLRIGGGTGRILDIGTGPGHIPLLLASAAPDCHVVGIDAAEQMLRIAARRIQDSEHKNRIELHQADAKRLSFPDQSFDAVFSNTILHHIPEPVQMLREAWRVLKPDGVLLIRDLFRPETQADAWQIVDRHAAKATESQRQLLFDSLHAALTLEEVRGLIHDVGMDHTTVEMTSDRHYTISRPRRATA